jgi:RNA polymerase-binding transcription factor DksA
MAKSKKNARSGKTAKSKKPAAKKVAAKKTPSKKHHPKKKKTGKVTGTKNAAKKKKTAKAPVKKAPVKKAPVKKAPVKKASAKKAPVKKVPAKKSKASPKRASRPAAAPKRAKVPARKTKPVKKPATKPKAGKSEAGRSEARKAEARKMKAGRSEARKTKVGKTAPKTVKTTEAPVVPATPAAPAVPATEATPMPAPAKSDTKRDLLRKNIIGGKKLLRPTTFTLDEALEIAKNAAKSVTDAAAPAAAQPSDAQTPAAPAKPDLDELAKAIAPSHVQAASLADILGFNPKKAQKARLFADPETIPEKYRRYYKLLLDLRSSLTEGLSLHTEETLRRSTKDDAGDLSSYGQHMADAGTDTFDRDFALSMVANEQEALTEIDAAIKRIENGTYGICEVTQKPIARERLLAVPFTRYSTEAQKEIERNRMRVRTAAGLFGEIGDDVGRVDDGRSDEE